MTRRETVAVTGMSCDGCERTVENALRTVGGVRRAEANHENGTVYVVVDDDVDDEAVDNAIHDAGYEVA